jgi:hypothetical protein
MSRNDDEGLSQREAMLYDGQGSLTGYCVRCSRHGSAGAKIRTVPVSQVTSHDKLNQAAHISLCRDCESALKADKARIAAKSA